MTESDAVVGSACPSLRAIRCLHEPKDQICYSCAQAIGSATLIRTYQVDSAAANPISLPGTYNVSALGRRITFFNRHFECFVSKNFMHVSVSHVWSSLVSEFQNRGSEEIDDESEEAIEASRIVFTEAIQLYDGISRSIETSFEAWQDYLSIPQWDLEAKVQNLLKISDIFQHSWFTVIYWHDVEQSAVQQIRDSEGEPSPALIGALNHICSSAWHRRMWTAMEYFRSRRVRVMVKDHLLCEDGDDLHQQKIGELWNEAGIRLGGNVAELESRAGLEKNLLPWQIRGVDTMRRSQAKDFALAFQRLALRECTVPLDFYYAMGGLVGFKERLSPDVASARWQIIRGCMENQDYSPILMPSEPTYSEHRFHYGLNDIRSWGLGPLVTGANNRLSTRGMKAVFQAQLSGEVVLIEPCWWEPIPTDPSPYFEQPARIVLTLVGPNVDNFVLALCLRIIGVNHYAVLRRLRQKGRYSMLQETLETLYRRSTPWPHRLVMEMIHDLSLDTIDLHSDQLPEDKERQPRFWRQWTDGAPRPAPIYFHMTNGGSIHLDEKSAFVGMVCPGCSQTIMTRAALYKPLAEVSGATGFRIPGLQYERTLPDGIGILVKNEQIVGRFLFCCPCCSNVPTREIEVELPAIPLPCPNPTPYRKNEVD